MCESPDHCPRPIRRACLQANLHATNISYQNRNRGRLGRTANRGNSKLPSLQGERSAHGPRKSNQRIRTYLDPRGASRPQQSKRPTLQTKTGNAPVLVSTHSGQARPEWPVSCRLPSCCLPSCLSNKGYKEGGMRECREGMTFLT